MSALTYRGHPAVTKAMFVADMQAHAAADRLVAGSYDTMQSGHWQGCAVGCGIHTINRVTGTGHRSGNHAALAGALGWPEWLTRLEDTLFEGLPADQRKSWPERLAQAVPDGADISAIRDQWLAKVLRQVVLPAAGKSAAIVERVALGLETGWVNDTRAAAAQAAWEAAEAAALEAAEAAAAQAAWEAAEAAEAEAEAAAAQAVWEAAREVARAAWAAAEAEAEAAAAAAARYAARYAAGTAAAAYVIMADLLIAELQAISDGATA